MYKIGEKLKVAKDNDNENYDAFRNEVLVVTSVATSATEHPGYDESMEGMGLYDFVTESGKKVPFSLYECQSPSTEVEGM